jgi:hypothetical protein
MVADFLAGICSSLIIEFVPKTDHRVQRLLSTREDIFVDYTQEAFETTFGQQFEIRASVQLEGSERIMYLMARRGS